MGPVVGGYGVAPLPPACGYGVAPVPPAGIPWTAVSPARGGPSYRVEFTGEGPTDARRVPVAVPLDGSVADDRGVVRELAPERHRFVTGPRLSPDGRRAAWLAWD
ncbi:hypothetical protein ACN6LL_003713, partial [Streptomyces violaceoruber]